jgi:phage-related protein
LESTGPSARIFGVSLGAVGAAASALSPVAVAAAGAVLGIGAATTVAVIGLGAFGLAMANTEQWRQHTDRLSASFKSFLNDGIEPLIAAPVKAWVDVLISRMGLLRGPIAATSGALVQLAAHFRAATAPGTEFARSWNTITAAMQPIIAGMGRAVINFLMGFLNLTAALVRTGLVTGMVNGIEGLSMAFRKWSEGLDQNRGFQNFVGWVKKYGPEIWGILGNVAAALGRIVFALAPFGMALLRAADAAATFIRNMPMGALQALVGAVAGLMIFASPLRTFFTALTGLLAKTGLAGASAGSGLGLLSKALGWIGLAVWVLQASWDSFVKMLKKVWESIQTHLAPAFRSLKDNLGEVFKNLQPFTEYLGKVFGAVWAYIGFLLGNIIIPVLGWLIRALGEVLTWISKLVGWVFQLVNALISGFVPAMQAVGRFFVMIWGGIVAAWDAFVNAIVIVWQAVSAAFMVAWTFFWNTIKTVASFIWMAMQAAWNAFIGALQAVWNAVSSAFMAVWTFFWNTIKAVASFIWTAMQFAWNTFILTLQAIWNAVSSALSAAWNAFWNALRAVASAIWTGMQAAWNAFIMALQAIWNAVSTALSAAWNAFWNALRAVASAIWTGMQAAWNAFIGALQTIWNAVSSALSAAWNAFWNALRAVASAIWTGMQAAWNAFIAALRTIWTTVSSALTAAWNAFWNGLRTVASAIWTGMQAAWNAFMNGVRAIWNAFSSALVAAWSAFWNGLKNLGNSIWNAIRGLWNAFTVGVRGIWNAFSSALVKAWDAFWNGLKNLGNSIWNATRGLWNAFTVGVRGIWNAFSSALATAWRTFWEGIKSIGNTIWNAIKGLWDGFTKGVRNIWNSFSSSFKSAWEGFWNTIKGAANKVWHEIGEIIEKAINGITGIINKLIGGFNNITGALKMGLKIPTIPSVNFNFAYGGVVGMPKSVGGPVMAFSRGGTVPGYAPGRDRVPAMLSPGEGVLTPEAVRGLGGPSFVHGANKRWSGRRGGGGNWHGGSMDGHPRHFATGGMVDGAQPFAMGGITLAALAKAGLAGVRIIQPEFNTGVAASAGTHDGGGVVDLPPDPAILAKLLANGWAAWMRTPAQGFAPHIHAVLMNHPSLSPAARAQVTSFLSGGNGLGSGSGGGGGIGDLFGPILENIGKILRVIAEKGGGLMSAVMKFAGGALKSLLGGGDDDGGGFLGTGIGPDIGPDILPDIGDVAKSVLGPIAEMVRGVVMGAITLPAVGEGFGFIDDKLKGANLPGGGFAEIAMKMGGELLKTAKDWIVKKAAELAPGLMSLLGGAGGGNVQQWAGLAKIAMVMGGLNPNQLGKFLALMQAESGGNPNAINLTDSNARAGQPSQGLMQVIPSTFAAYHVAGTSNNIRDPLANMAAAAAYIKARYGGNVPGSPYALGTMGATRGWHMVGERGPEFVNFRGGEQVMPNGKYPSDRNGHSHGDTHFHIDARGATREAMDKLDRDVVPKMRRLVQQGCGKHG